MLESVFLTTTETVITIQSLLICTITSLILGVAIAKIYMCQGTYSKGFVVTLAILPAIVQLVIMLVNGNLGTGMAVMGAFSLIRFRSAAGTARDISHIFLAMALGLATGMGLITIAIIFLLIIGGTSLLLFKSDFGKFKNSRRMLKIVIPDDLDYTTVFDDIFNEYTQNVNLNQVKTTNMGSLYELKYEIELIDDSNPKAFIDALRCRNGNLNIVCGRLLIEKEEL